MRPRAAPLVLALAAPALMVGCAVQPADVGVNADCEQTGDDINPVLVLMAQAVPTAQLIPCIGAVPSAWHRGPVDVRDGRGSFVFTTSSMEDADEAILSVVLTRSCDLDGATEVPSDEPGTQRFERLRDVGQGYEGDRLYVYDGGCTTLEFRLPEQGRAQQVGQAALAVSFMTRGTLRDMVRRRSDGRLELDGSSS
jgi:hypothetical protein